MKMGEIQSSHMTMFTTLAEVVSGAFGGKKDGKGAKAPITEDLTKLDTSAYLARASQLLSGNI